MKIYEYQNKCGSNLHIPAFSSLGLLLIFGELSQEFILWVNTGNIYLQLSPFEPAILLGKVSHLNTFFLLVIKGWELLTFVILEFNSYLFFV